MPKVINIPIQNKISLRLSLNAHTYTVVQKTSRKLIGSMGRKTRVVDPHHFFIADPGPAFQFNAEPDPDHAPLLG